MAVSGQGNGLAQEVYRRLHEAIISGVYRPNQRLIETDLAEELDASRTPVREGLQRLEVEGLVASVRRGWVVREHTADEIRDIYDIRVALEGHAARLAAERGTDEQLDEIAAIHRRSQDVSDEDGRSWLVDANNVFHEAIIAAARNDRLAHLILRNRSYYFNYRLARLYSERDASTSIEGHAAIVDALMRRDGRAAEEAVQQHLRQSLDVTLRLLR